MDANDADSVAYHRATVLGRADDHPGRALGYYASRGETPLAWGGSGAERLGLVGSVTDEHYVALFGPGGACAPSTGVRLVGTRRPGMEIVLAAHKSVAELGVLGRAEDMHQIMDAERDATLGYLDGLTQRLGGRRGRAAVAAPTSGLVYAVTRHATSRAGDPGPHDHVLLANVVEMLDAKGGYKAPDTTLWREHLHAATMVGRVASAHRAVELGYAIRADEGPSGRLGHWAITGIPEEALEVHSKRSAEIEAELATSGFSSYRARNLAARTSRDDKGHASVEDLLPHWREELAQAGYPVPLLLAGIERTAAEQERRPERLHAQEREALVADVLHQDQRLAERKVFTRRDVVVAVAPRLFGSDPSELTRTVDLVLASPEAVPLLGVAGARERAYACASVIATEQAIADSVERSTARRDAPRVPTQLIQRAIDDTETSLGRPLTAGQDLAVRQVCASGHGVDLVLGVAGAGKTTCLAAVADAYRAGGFEVLGTATSGQAARTLGTEAGIEHSRTLASVLWRLDHHRLDLHDRSVVLLDEGGMTDDRSLLRLVTAAELSRAKVILVGDDRQLGAIGPGGSLGALLERYGDAVHVLRENVRQVDPGERTALAELRSGDVVAAVEWYATHSRIVARPDREAVLDDMVAAWATDVGTGRDAALFAWRRANVEELNRRARVVAVEREWVSGPELVEPGGRRYASGDRVVTLAPGADGQLVTSERGTVTVVDAQEGTMTARMDDGRSQRFAQEDTAADRLAYGYAVTVHRSQGMTVDVTHGLEDGGGRELAYVRMSRARRRSTAYVVADSVEQAVEDLRREWSAERRQRWAIDTGTPGHGVAEEADAVAQVLRRDRLKAEREAVAAAIPDDPRVAIVSANSELFALREARDDLEQGRGVYAGTEIGRAARTLIDARTHRQWLERLAEQPALSWRARRGFRRRARGSASIELDAQGPWGEKVATELERLDLRMAELTTELEAAGAAREVRDSWIRAHPEVDRRLQTLDRELSREAGVAGVDVSVRRDRAVEHDHGVDIGW